jgi:hypothetical protein
MEERYGTSSYTIDTPMFLILERRTIPRTIPPSNDTKNDICPTTYLRLDATLCLSPDRCRLSLFMEREESSRLFVE